MNLRKMARGRDCMVRLPGICNRNPETTVLAHYRMHGLSGIGLKSNDLFGAWACSSCHDEIDRRSRNMDSADCALFHLEGVLRTQQALLLEGAIQA